MAAMPDQRVGQAELADPLQPGAEGGAESRSPPLSGWPGRQPSPAPDDLPLTRRESEITQLIATGLTNRQIAERLVIAQRTVDTHVGHILAKLGCSNRSQAAALVGARQAPSLPR